MNKFRICELLVILPSDSWAKPPSRGNGAAGRNHLKVIIFNSAHLDSRLARIVREAVLNMSPAHHP